MSQRPFSQACENNKQSILNVLQKYFDSPLRALEIGSGTGQHGHFFAQELPHVIWQTSDLRENHPGINAWVASSSGNNLLAPFELDVTTFGNLVDEYQAVYTANTAHIMSWEQVVSMIQGVGALLQNGGLWIVYGPFNYSGQFTSESNARFDQWLKSQAAHRAIRDFEAVCEQALAAGLVLQEDCSMPANNRCLVFRKQHD